MAELSAFERALAVRFSANVLARARKLRGKSLRVDPQFDSVWWVTGSTGAGYRVQLYTIEGETLPAATCTCPHGMNNSPATCWHVAAVLMEHDGA